MKHNTVDLDGTIYAYQIDHDLNLVSVTIAGYSDQQPTIVMFDKDDLDTLNNARKELKRGRPTEPDPGAVLEILAAASRADRFVYDRVEYRYNPKAGTWLAWGRVDTEDDEPVCECDEAGCPNFHVDHTW